MASGKSPVMPESLETQKKLVVLLHRLPVTQSTDPSHVNLFSTSRNGGKETQSSGLGGERETGESNSCSFEGSSSLRKTRLDQTRQKRKMIPMKDCPTVSFELHDKGQNQCGLLVLHEPPHGSDIPSSNNNFSSCYVQRNTSSTATSCENASTCSWAEKNDPLASLCAYIGKKMKNIHKTPQKNVKKVNPVSSTDCEHADNAITRGTALNRTSLGSSDVSEHQECSEPHTAVSWKGGLCGFTDSKELPLMYRQPGEPQKHKQRNPPKKGFVEWQQIGSSDTILSIPDPFIEDIQAADQQATAFSNFISEPLDANVSNVSDPDPGSSPQSGVPGPGICGLGHPKDSCAPNLTACGTLGNGACNTLTLDSEKDIQTHVGTGRHMDSERSKPIHFPTTTSTTGERFSVHPKSLIVTVRNMEASERQVLKRVNSGSSVKNVTQSLRNNGCCYPSDGIEHSPDRPAEGDPVCQKNDQHRSISKDIGTVSHTSEGNKRKLKVTYPGKRLCTCNMSDPLHKTILKMTKCPCPGETGSEDQSRFCECSKHGSQTCCPAHRREMPRHTGLPVAQLKPVHVLRQKRLRIGKVYRNVPSFNNCYDGERMDNDKTYGTLHQGRKSPWHKKQASDVYRQVKLFKYTIGRITSKSLLFYLKHRKKRAVWASLPCKICMRMVYTKTFFRMPAPTLNLQQWPKLCFTQRRDTCLSCRRVKGSLTKTRTCAKEAHLCTECGKRFIQLDVLNLHQRSHSEAKLFVCSVCGRRFVQQALLLIHQKTHLRRKPHQCMDCGQTFHVKELFVAHQKTHRVEKPHCCTDCGKCFADRSTLLIHQRVHTGEKPFNCLDCGKSFSQHSTLISHQRIHTGEKPFSCHDCGRQFGDRSAYASHRRTHTGEKPFKCEGCGKRFAQSSNLRRHERIHTGQKPYACAECGRTFNENTKLKAHLHVHLKKGN